MNLFQQTVSAIRPADRSLLPAIQAHLDDLTKPQGSLGRLESLALQYCLAAHTLQPVPGKLRLYCFAGDHGVASEGVSAFPKEVTPQMVGNMLAGGAAINVFTRHVGAELRVVDMGVDADLQDFPGLIHRKVARGTANIAAGPAMSRDQASCRPPGHRRDGHSQYHSRHRLVCRLPWLCARRNHRTGNGRG
jgi:nicotinate-nucleotide--dimethylbenzimidazole phosphoribosyltransferase